MTGKVLLAEQAVAGAIVRLVGDLSILGAVRGAAIDAPGAVTWSRRVTGFAGTLRTAWDRFAAGEVAGLTWDDFRRQAVIANPVLAASEGRFERTRAISCRSTPPPHPPSCGTAR